MFIKIRRRAAEKLTVPVLLLPRSRTRLRRPQVFWRTRDRRMPSPQSNAST